jgi:ABC-type multidrug transport system ATPase subunit
MSIEVSNLTKIYGQQKAIDNISFKIDKAEIVGFLAPELSPSRVSCKGRGVQT